VSLDRVDVVVIGAGVVGAAVAHTLARKGFSVVILEAGPRVAEGVTSRNSGVIHSGLYYPPQSNKAVLCVEGNQRLYAWCQSNNVWHSRCGKLVVANNHAQLPALNALHANAVACGATGLSLCSAAQVAALEPDIPAVGGLLCADTGIVDPVELTQSLLAATEALGGLVLTNAKVQGVRPGYVLETTRGPITAERVVNAAGLHSDEVAALAGVTTYKIHPCKGDYFRLRSPRHYRHLIYPLKDAAAPGLGVHLTLDRHGGYRLGPDAYYINNKTDFSAPPEDKLEQFRRAAERLLGPIPPGQLSYDTCGIRPKLRAPDELEEKDFVIAEDVPGFFNLVGIESPGLTAALAIAERVAAAW